MSGTASPQQGTHHAGPCSTGRWRGRPTPDTADADMQQRTPVVAAPSLRSARLVHRMTPGRRRRRRADDHGGGRQKTCLLREHKRPRPHRPAQPWGRVHDVAAPAAPLRRRSGSTAAALPERCRSAIQFSTGQPAGLPSAGSRCRFRAAPVRPAPAFRHAGPGRLGRIAATLPGAALREWPSLRAEVQEMPCPFP